MSNKNEQLEALLSQFMDASQARQFQDDLSQIDHLFRTHPVESLDANTLETVRTRVFLALRHHRYWNMAKWYTTVAAVVIGTMVAGLFVLYSPEPGSRTIATVPRPTNQTVQRQFWSDTLFAIAMENDPIEQELTEISKSIQSVRVAPYAESADTLTIDLQEIEEIDSLTEESNFWKGMQI